MINIPFLLSREFFEGFVYNLQRRKKGEAFFLSSSEKSDEKIISVVGDIATINIRGSLVSKSSFLDFFRTTTSYSSILEALKEAENSKASKIILSIDSPGGDVNGVEKVAKAIKNSKKEITAHVENIAASAAYWIASQADNIVATTSTVRVGSIGILAQVVDWSKHDKNMGVEIHTIVSRKSPDKVPDISTEEGRNKIRGILDDLLEVFVEQVAEGRGVSIKDVFENFGKGDMVIASKALSRGMIDAIGISNKGEKIMASEFNKEEAILAGVQQERSRVIKLLEWTSNNAVMEIVFEAIRNGKTQDDILGSLVKASSMPSEAVAMQEENAPSISNLPKEKNEEDEINKLVSQALKFSMKAVR